MLQRYKVVLKEKNQPMLFKNFRNIREYYPAEICQEASLPADFTTDAKKMRGLQGYKISTPNDRFARIKEVPNRFCGI